MWRRDGRSVQAVLVFVRKTPTYRKRLDFEGIAGQVASTQFETEFNKAAADLVQRRGG